MKNGFSRPQTGHHDHGPETMTSGATETPRRSSVLIDLLQPMLACATLDPYEKVILAYMLSRHGVIRSDGNHWQFNITDIADSTSMDRNTVARRLKKFADIGFAALTGTKKHGVNIQKQYSLLPTALAAFVKKADATGRSVGDGDARGNSTTTPPPTAPDAAGNSASTPPGAALNSRGEIREEIRGNHRGEPTLKDTDPASNRSLGRGGVGSPDGKSNPVRPSVGSLSRAPAACGDNPTIHREVDSTCGPLPSTAPAADLNAGKLDQGVESVLGGASTATAACPVPSMKATPSHPPSSAAPPSRQDRQMPEHLMDACVEIGQAWARNPSFKGELRDRMIEALMDYIRASPSTDTHFLWNEARRIGERMFRTSAPNSPPSSAPPPEPK